MSGQAPDSISDETHHPLFDSRSLYRQATSLSVWSDHGTPGMQQFFDDWDREWLTYLYEEAYLNDVPTEWGYSKEMNEAYAAQMVADRERRKARLARAQEQAAAPQAQQFQQALNRGAAAGRDKAAPADSKATLLVACDGKITEQNVGTGANADVFISGLSDVPEGAIDLERKSDEFRLRIRRNSGAGRRAIFLLLRSNLLDRVRWMINEELSEKTFPPIHHRPPKFVDTGDPVDSAQAAKATVEQLLQDDAAVLSSSEEDEDIVPWRRSFWLSSTLALAPGLEGVMTADADDDICFSPYADGDQPASHEFRIPLSRPLQTLKTDQERYRVEFPDQFFPLLVIGPNVC